VGAADAAAHACLTKSLYQARAQPALLAIALPPSKETAMSIRRSSRTLAVAFVVASLTATPALAQDLRSPDAQDAARHAAPVTNDMRSPDAVDAGRPTPDLRVTASLAGPPRTPPTAVAVPPAGDSFDWTSAGIGAGGTAVALVALGGGLTVVSRRRRIAAA
jgi:hypothetical protein